MLKIAICDDDLMFMQNTAALIRQWADQSGIPADLFLFDNGDELITKSTSLHIDIIFLDIIMPMLNGMDTARELRQKNTAVNIIFLTSSKEFALESYDVRAQGYLLKPVSYTKIKETLDECARSFETEPKNLILKTPFGYQKLYFHDIEYAEAQNKKVLFHLKSGRTIEAIQPLYSFEDKFTDENGFFKCHRSYFVYLPNVDHFSSTEITTKSGATIPISRGFAKAFKEAYFTLMFQE